MTAQGPDDAELARRLAAFATTRNAADLWPGLLEAERVAAAKEIERVTRAVLAGGAEVTIDASHRAYALKIAGHTTGLGPLLGRWVELGTVHAPAPVLHAFAHQLEGSRERAARIEREVMPAIDALLARGITPVVLKGFHTARRYFEEPGVRRMSDVDLLVPVDRLRDAEAALSSAGFRPLDREARDKRDWIGSNVEPHEFSIERDDPRSKWTIELHTSLDRHFHPGAVATLDCEIHAVTPFDIAGRRVAVPVPAVLAIILACHCSQELDASRLLRLVEIVRLVRIERLDWNAVIAILERTRAARYTYPAFALAEDLVPGTIDPRVLTLGRRASTRAAQHTVRRLAPAGGALDARGVARQMMWTSGPIAVLQRVLRTLWPASFVRPGDVIPGWRVRMRRLRAGTLSLTAPDERSRINEATPTAPSRGDPPSA
jgi:hypothetical protein